MANEELDKNKPLHAGHAIRLPEKYRQLPRRKLNIHFVRLAQTKKAINTKGGSIDGQLAGKRLLTIHTAYQEAAQTGRIV
ncbi:hypothetical protein [Eikenella longinqua]|uniref:hypothetical protein n=1 Tax=Eikenella longinqua TaxID=1795827 RepID=UPI000B18C5EB|nr:hypothetical protein [Eikenella longinqua]